MLYGIRKITLQFLLFQILAIYLAAKKVGQILHLTDFHIDPDYNAKNGRISAFCHLDNNSNMRRNAPGGKNETAPGMFGDHRCDAPKMLLEYVLGETKRIVAAPELIIWTGDNTPHVDFNSTEYAIDSIESTSEAIRRYFGGHPATTILPTMGNHDFTPANFVPDQPNELYERTFDLWEKWIGKDQQDTFRQGGYYKFNWRGQIFLVLNTNLYYVYNHQKLTHPEDPAGQFDFLEQQLKLAVREGKKVNIIGHIPPGAFEREFLKLMPPVYNQRLLYFLRKYAQWTNWLVFGHLHTDTFRILKYADSDPIQVIFVSAAVSPFKTNNPAFRVYDFDMDSMEIVDIKNYFVDLDELNRAGANTRMRLEYSMREAYGMDSLRPKEFGILLEKLKRDEAAFSQYIRFNSVQSNSTAPSHMERAYQLCAIEFLDHDEYSKCVEEYPVIVNGTRKAIIMKTNWPFLLLTIIILFIF